MLEDVELHVSYVAFYTIAYIDVPYILRILQADCPFTDVSVYAMYMSAFPAIKEQRLANR